MSTISAKAIPVLLSDPATFVREAARDAVLELLFMDIELKDEYDIRVKPGFNTAAWAYLPPHRVYVGDGIVGKAKAGLSEDELRQYVQKHVFHEFGHLLFTERNLRELNEQLAALDAPFSLFNLFEDARIEERFRSLTKSRFNWSWYEDIERNADPAAIFFSLVQHEGDSERVRQELALTPSVDQDSAVVFADILIEVLRFYENCKKASSSSALLPIIEEWLIRFGKPAKRQLVLNGQSAEVGSEGDLVPALFLPGDERAQQEFEAGTQPLSAGSSEKDVEDAQRVNPESEGTGDLLVEERVPLDRDRVVSLAEQLFVLFESEARLVSSWTPSRRISVRHYACGRAPYRHRFDQARSTTKKVLLLIDCSGSMEGFPIEEGRVLLGALNELACHEHVFGHVVLSAVIKDKKGPRAIWQRFSLPMRIEDLERVPTEPRGAAEGLEHAIRSNADLAREADHVWVYTDARIYDDPIDKPTLHAQGIYTWGLYAGNTENVREQLLQYFDTVILESNADKLIESMLNQT